MTKRTTLLIFVFLCFIKGSFGQAVETPSAKKIPNQLIIHNDTLIDNYFWLRDKYSPEVINYLYAENEYADEMMKSSSLLQKVLFEEYKSRRNQTYNTRPTKSDGYYYYNKYEKSKEYEVVCRKKDSLTSKEQVVLDVNKLAANHGYISVSGTVMSPDQSLMYYGIDSKGNRLSDFYLKNIDKDSVFESDTLKQINSLVWAEDNKTVFYAMPEPKTLRSYRIYRHILGTPVKSDILVFEETDNLFNADISKSSSKNYFFINSGSSTTSESWYFKADGIEFTPKLFLKKKKNSIYSLDHYEGDEFFITSNLNAINNRFSKTKIYEPEPGQWVDVIAARANVMLLKIEMTKDYLLVQEKENAQSRIRIINKQTQQDELLPIDVTFCETAFSIPDYDYNRSNTIEFSYSNMVTPQKELSYNLYTHEKKILEQDTILGNYNPNIYEVKRIYATASDGAKVPITLAHKKGLVLDGNNPIYLNSYGSYGIATTGNFSASYLSYLERGFVVAVAHIRGGNDLGRQWYDDGKMLKKKNTFTDFISCAEYLISEKYTNPKKLAIRGGSAGGLLMGAVTNMRPDLFACVNANVPFVDVINTMLDESLPLTTGEFEEWGNPKNKEYYQYMKTYSPYDNVVRKSYPNILVTAGYDDSQVAYWEPAKWVAKLRTCKADTNLLLLKTTMQGGHEGPSGRYSQWKSAAFELAFVMRSLGIKENYLTISGKVVDENKTELPFANVYIEGTTNGTTTNINGEFSLRVKEINNISLVAQSLGFATHKEKLNIDTPSDNLILKLKSENILMNEVVVSSNAKDPAIRIIKEAIRLRKENLENLNCFSADVYMKATARLLEIPKKGPIRKLLINDGDTTIGLVYLSESVAKYYFQRPDKTKEEMIASKVAGAKQGFSWNRVEDVFVSFYEPTIKFGYSERPFVSPIAPTAMFSYKYKYKGTIFVDDKPIHKIQVMPRIKGDPAFYGDIYITEDNYQLYSCNLYGIKEQQIEFTDTAYLKQEMTKIDSIWVPMQLQTYALISVLGIKATELSRATMSNYTINKKFPPNFFSKELFRINPEANKKDTSYWQTTRPSVLTEEERKHYTKGDRLEVLKTSKQFRDSVLKVKNKFKMGEFLLSGYTRQYDDEKYYKDISIPGLLFLTNYNTVQGTNVDLNINYTQRDKATYKTTMLSLYTQYGFDNKKLYSGLTYESDLDRVKKKKVSFNVGRYAMQINNQLPIFPVVNSLYTLLGKQNYMKLYNEDKLTGGYKQELINGLIISTEASYKIREPLSNTSYYYWIENNKREFTSNDPLAPLNFSPAFQKHQLVVVNLSANIIPFASYEVYPYEKRYRTKWPEISINYKKGIATKDASFNYDFISAGLGKDISIRTWGNLSIDVVGGKFFNAGNMNFIDYNHFFGNQTVLLNGDKNKYTETRMGLVTFKALPYYSYSTNNQYVEMHIEHNFNSFFVGKIPLLRKTGIYEVVGTNVLITPQIMYTEYYVGMDNILKFLRIDGVATYSNSGKPQYNIRVGLRL